MDSSIVPSFLQSPPSLCYSFSISVCFPLQAFLLSSRVYALTFLTLFSQDAQCQPLIRRVASSSCRRSHTEQTLITSLHAVYSVPKQIRESQEYLHFSAINDIAFLVIETSKQSFPFETTALPRGYTSPLFRFYSISFISVDFTLIICFSIFEQNCCDSLERKVKFDQHRADTFRRNIFGRKLSTWRPKFALECLSITRDDAVASCSHNMPL